MAGHDYNYKVFVTVRPFERVAVADNNSSAPFPRLNFACNVGIKYVPDTTDASIPAYITEHDSWSFFHLPLDVFTCDDNFSSYQPQNFITNMLRLMKFPFDLESSSRLFLKISSEDEKEEEEEEELAVVRLENFENIVTAIFNAACGIADTAGFPDNKSKPCLLVRIEKIVNVPRSEYLGIILKAKKDELFSKIRDQIVRMLQLEKEGHKLGKSEWKNMVDIVVKSGFGQAMCNHLTSLMKMKQKQKQSSRESNKSTSGSGAHCVKVGK